ncbi:hypothetical protein CR513_00840, partial [Mucuna pruriens]
MRFKLPRSLRKNKKILRKSSCLRSGSTREALNIISNESMGCVLGQQDAIGKKEQGIYYLSKKFTNCEKRYPTLEQTYYAMVWVAKRLRQYMLANTT